MGAVLLPPATVVEQLQGISSRTLAGWRSTGKGPRYVRVGKKPYYLQEDVDAWIESQRFRSTSEEYGA